MSDWYPSKILSTTLKPSSVFKWEERVLIHLCSALHNVQAQCPTGLQCGYSKSCYTHRDFRGGTSPDTLIFFLENWLTGWHLEVLGGYQSWYSNLILYLENHPVSSPAWASWRPHSNWDSSPISQLPPLSTSPWEPKYDSTKPDFVLSLDTGGINLDRSICTGIFLPWLLMFVPAAC